MSPLHQAILVGSVDEVSKLWHASEDNNYNLLKCHPMHLAVFRPQHLKLLLEAGAQVNCGDWNGRTPLMYAAATGSSQIAISLIEAGANPWTRDKLYGSEDFMNYAIRHHHWQRLLKILDHVRTSPRFCPNDVQSLLDRAVVLWANAQRRRFDHFSSLLEWGANPNISFKARWEFIRDGSNTLLHRIGHISHL